MRKRNVCPVKAISIQSVDSKLFEACVDALRPYNISLIQGHDSSAPADLVVWDCRGLAELPHLDTDNLAHCMFLVDRESLVRFPGDVLLFSAAVALLPIDSPRLRLAFEQAFARLGVARREPEADSRSQKDALLQCFLQANLKLQEYEQDRTTFLNRALHDFRAPLTSIAGYAGILMSGQAGPLDTHQTEVIQRIQNSAKRLARLADGLFQLGIRQFRAVKPDASKGDISSVMESAVFEVGTFLTQKHILTSIQLEEPEGELYFESEKIVQLVVNILENACRFAPKRSTIHINGYPYFWERRSRSTPARNDGGAPERRSRQQHVMNCYRIDISDSGPGILPEHLGSIFEEYTSFSGNNDRSGTGLGLAISKGIVQMHEGRIWAESRQGGATFSFVLPYSVREASQELALAAASATLY